jgi:hypothetical protein
MSRTKARQAILKDRHALGSQVRNCGAFLRHDRQIQKAANAHPPARIGFSARKTPWTVS